jgi:alpha-amylase/alpha-mannosidase (GH57 family)
VHPERFSAPDDAETHVRLAREAYERLFGCAPRGMWPAEGAVSQDVVPLFADPGVRWIASDGGVLRSRPATCRTSTVTATES